MVRPPLTARTETLTPAPGKRGDMSDTPVDPDEVRHVADLARVDVDDEEAERFAEQFADILDYFETLEKVPEVDADPELVNVMRADEVGECLDRAAVLDNASETEAGHFKGPHVS
jgi:aspartyl-tRNA(Asn)/glutamyl-tRNA(Gln) amidotransferase subunit C